MKLSQKCSFDNFIHDKKLFPAKPQKIYFGNLSKKLNESSLRNSFLVFHMMGTKIGKSNAVLI
jgi:hypothetical protein